MPLGSRHDESGLLLAEGRFLILQRDDRGRWRLDAPLRAERYLGHRVRVTGVRSGFDLLDVEKVERC